MTDTLADQDRLFPVGRVLERIEVDGEQHQVIDLGAYRDSLPLRLMPAYEALRLAPTRAEYADLLTRAGLSEDDGRTLFARGIVMDFENTDLDGWRLDLSAKVGRYEDESFGVRTDDGQEALIGTAMAAVLLNSTPDSDLGGLLLRALDEFPVEPMQFTEEFRRTLTWLVRHRGADFFAPAAAFDASASTRIYPVGRLVFQDGVRTLIDGNRLTRWPADQERLLNLLLSGMTRADLLERARTEGVEDPSAWLTGLIQDGVALSLEGDTTAVAAHLGGHRLVSYVTSAAPVAESGALWDLRVVDGPQILVQPLTWAALSTSGSGSAADVLRDADKTAVASGHGRDDALVCLLADLPNLISRGAVALLTAKTNEQAPAS